MTTEITIANQKAEFGKPSSSSQSYSAQEYGFSTDLSPNVPQAVSELQSQKMT